MTNKKELDVLLDGNADGELQRDIENLMQTAGIYCRVFSRIKKTDSLQQKLEKKKEQYTTGGKKVQDIVGVRIVLYFNDDCDLCRHLIEGKYQVDWENSVIDDAGTSEFGPVRFNLVCRMPEKISSKFDADLWRQYPLDQTFELQIRTIFSEGWHEINHDIRYKHSEIWNTNEYKEFGRCLNSIFATLELCDNSIIDLMDKMSYDAYKKCRVEEMFRFKFRIHFANDSMNPELLNYLKANKRVLKEFYKIERKDVLGLMANSELEVIPKSMDNILFICNKIWVKDEVIQSRIPVILNRKLDGLDLANIV